MEVEAEHGENYDVHMEFTRYLRGFPLKLFKILVSMNEYLKELKRLLKDRQRSEDSASEEPQLIYRTLGSEKSQRFGYA